MAAVLRLQGLNIEAGSEDIRRFFHGLHVPDGRVHIIGGPTGEAFIIFDSERDIHLALQKSGQLLRGSPVTLQTSSMIEMKQALELELKLRKHKSFSTETKPLTVTTKAIYEAVLLGYSAGIQEMQMSQCQSAQDLPLSPKPGQDANREEQEVKERISEPAKAREELERGRSKSKSGYLRLYGLPDTVSEQEIQGFLSELSVVEVIVNAFQGQERCCLVKLTSLKEAQEGLKYSHKNLKDFCVKVRLAHERMWTNALEGRETSPFSSSEKDRSSPGRCSYRNSPVKRQRVLSGSPKRSCQEPLPLAAEYCVMVKNLPTHINKTNIKQIFSCHALPRHNVLHLLDAQGERTSTAFVIFTQPEEYASAMNMNSTRVGSRTIEVSSITKAKMEDLMRQNRFGQLETSQPHGRQERSGRSCIYARNFPANVTKADVKLFFGARTISESDIRLLEDENGNGIGEAVVKFGNEKRASEARGLHGKLFRGEKILLTCISKEQIKDIVQKPQ